MSANPTSGGRRRTLQTVVAVEPARAAALLSELEALLPTLPIGELLDVRSAIVRLEDAAFRAAIAGKAPTMPGEEKDLTLTEAAEYLGGMSASWLYHRRRELRIGYKLGGEWRFTRAELDRVQKKARQRLS